MLRINDVAPNFEAETTHGLLSFHEWLGDSWCVLFSHPKDFTPVCTTELGYMAGLQSEFEKRNCKIIGLSADPVTDHGKWAADIEKNPGPQGTLFHDRRFRPEGRQTVRDASGGSGRYMRRPDCRQQRYRSNGIHDRSGQEDQTYADLSDDYWP